MPLNVGRFCTSIIFIFALSVIACFAQTPQATQSPAATAPNVPVLTKTPTAAEVMRDRISKAKAFIAVRNYNAAIYELEQIRRESGDPSVRSVTNVLLMNSYLEQGDYKRAQAMLTEFYSLQKTTKPDALQAYSIVAGQVVKGARNQAERYRSLGLSVTDRNLPLEALTDLEKMRETVELVITQAKELTVDKTKSATAMALLEEATSSRAVIARDEYDAKRWRDAMADSREELANSRSVIVNAVDGSTTSAFSVQPPVTTADTSERTAAPSTGVAMIPVSSAADKPSTIPPASPSVSKATAKELGGPPVPATSPETSPVKEIKPPTAEDKERPRVIVGAEQRASNTSPPKPDTSTAGNTTAPPNGGDPLEVGSLVAYATRQTQPVYPPTARAMRTTGVVRVEVTVDEEGNVSEIGNASGPMLLQASARDAVKKWKFRPFVIDGQPVKATGFVSFNFSL